MTCLSLVNHPRWHCDAPPAICFFTPHHHKHIVFLYMLWHTLSLAFLLSLSPLFVGGRFLTCVTDCKTCCIPRFVKNKVFVSQGLEQNHYAAGQVWWETSVCGLKLLVYAALRILRVLTPHSCFDLDSLHGVWNSGTTPPKLFIINR